MKFPVEVVLPQVDAPILGRIQDVRDPNPSQVLLLPQGGPVAQDDSGKDLVAVDALADTLVLSHGRREARHCADVRRGHQEVPVQEFRLPLALLEGQAGRAAALRFQVVVELDPLHGGQRGPPGLLVVRLIDRHRRRDVRWRVFLVARRRRRRGPRRRRVALHGLRVDRRPGVEPVVQQLDVPRAQDGAPLERPLLPRLSLDARLPTGEGVLLRVPPDHLIELAVLRELLLTQLLPPIVPCAVSQFLRPILWIKFFEF